MVTPRGIRNNNPLNIRKGNNWKGERHPQSDTQFEEFDSMLMGLRAGIKLIQNYINGNTVTHVPCRTIDSLISRWAPPSENATEKYIEVVAQRSGISRYQRLFANRRDDICRIVQAMCFVECGQDVDPTLIRSAWDLL